jgi:hypothetical protein
MTILHLRSLSWALLAAPIILLYLWRLRPQRLDLSTGFLWERVFGAPKRRSAWWPLRRPVSLFLHLVLLALLCLAMAEPHFGPFSRPARLVVVIDNSASMNAVDAEPTRLDRAKELARELIAALGDRDRLAIVSAGDAVSVHCGLTGRRETWEEALRAVGATDGATRVREAVALARQVLNGDPAGRIVVLSDGCFDGAEELARQDDVEWTLVGGPGDNVAVTAFEARRNLDDPERAQVFAELTSFASEPVACHLELQWGGRPLSTVPVELPAAGRWQHVFEMTSRQGGRLTARLDRSDAFPRDDLASAVLPPAAIHRVTLVTGGNVHLEKALEANPRVELTVADAPPERLDKGTVLVLDGQVPARLPQAPALVVDPTGPCDLWELGGPLEDAVVAKQNEALALLADVRLERMSLPGVRRIELTGEARAAAEPVAWTEDGTPIGYAVERPGARVLVLSGLMQGSDLPLRPAFPILIGNALDWVAARGDSDYRPDAGRVAVESGVFASSESDIRVPAGLASLAEAPAIRAPGTPHWLFPAALALFMVAVEWSLFQRRWTC